ncbi:MAG: acyl-CoA dehydrogenase [Pseudomonadales bacterium]|nr:acyl-CoA dehydrogenase [Pseudomonadales bacterium]
MSEANLITETATRIFQDLCTPEVIESAEAGTWPAKLWQTVEETGLTLAGVDESAGGSGGEIADAMEVIAIAAKFAVPLPIAETFRAAKLLESVGASVPGGPMTVAVGEFRLESGTDGLRLRGGAMGVPFAGDCHAVVLAAQQESRWKLCCVPIELAAVTFDRNMAGEERSRVDIDCALAQDSVFEFAGDDPDTILHAMGALVRSVMMAGALQAVLELSVQYALERQQFGRPIAKFQAIQQQLAVLAGEVAVCQRAADAVKGHMADLDPLEIGVAKARIGEAVCLATDIAHQVHGAMGYTREHALNLRTRRLWCWRDEFGNETFWQRRLGEAITAMGADNLWGLIASG